MKHLIVGLLLVLTFITTCAQTVGSILTPSPISVAITVGMWVTKNRDKFYQIEVRSEAATFEQAKAEAFRLAVEQAVGSLILAESEMRDRTIQRNEIISYASGYISEFDITQREETGNRVRLTMKVWVAESRIANRLLNRSTTTNTIDPNASVRVETILQERYQGDRVLNAVLADFPKRAFDIELGVNTVSLNNQRRVKLNIPFKLKWNYDYLTSLYDSAYATRQERAACWIRSPECAKLQQTQSTFSMSVKPPQNWFMSWAGTVAFDDSFKVQSMANTFIGSRPAVMLTLRDDMNNVVKKSCYYWPELDHNIVHSYPSEYMFNMHNNNAGINGNFVLNGQIELDTQSIPLAKLEKITLEVIKGNQCPT